MADSESSGWYRRAFGDDYLYIYSHRSIAAAEKETLLAINHFPYESGQHILDLACGAGRHMLAFRRIGAEVTGADISAVLLEEARNTLGQAGMSASLVRADMRFLPFHRCFDGVTLWFTSFGYFETVSEDLKTLRSIESALREGGWWWIDIPNPEHLASTLVPVTKRKIDGPNGRARVTERRRIDNDLVVKEIEITDSLGKRSYVERVRLYMPEMFGALTMRAGLTPRGILGDYDGSPFGPESPRQIWFGVRA